MGSLDEDAEPTEADMKRFSLIKKEIDAHVAELRALVARLNDANIFN
jgi:hypothetical protein